MSKKYKRFVAATSDYEMNDDGEKIAGFIENCTREKQAKKFLLDWMLIHDRGKVIRRADSSGRLVTATIALVIVELSEEDAKLQGLASALDSQGKIVPEWSKNFEPKFDEKSPNGWNLSEIVVSESEIAAAQAAADHAARVVAAAKAKADADEKAKAEAEAESKRMVDEIKRLKDELAKVKAKPPAVDESAIKK